MLSSTRGTFQPHSARSRCVTTFGAKPQQRGNRFNAHPEQSQREDVRSSRAVETGTARQSAGGSIRLRIQGCGTGVG